jgi:hypothetical protein
VVGGSRFAVVDVYVDAGDVPLAAWQVEVRAVAGSVKLVGVEGGEHAAFREPPFYDPAALHAGDGKSDGRIILGAFNIGDELPTGRTRVARLHVEVEGEAKYEAKLTACATRDGDRITGRVEAIEGGAK